MGTPYKLKITLEGTSPPIWRRILVPDDLVLGDLHTVIQVVMGWENAHLHQFEVGSRRFDDNDGGFDESAENEDEVTLGDVLGSRKRKLTYTYDFGDSWTHVITVEKRPAKGTTVEFPRCLGGKRAGPPEDSGGAWGYEYKLETLEDPEHPDHDDVTEWLGEDFDPDAFDLEAVNELLRRLFTIEWIGGFVDPLSEIIRDTSEASEAPVFVFWIDMNGDELLGQAPSSRDDWREAAIDLLETALVDVDSGVVSSPHRVRVDDEELSKKVAALLDSRSISVECTPLPEREMIAEELAQAFTEGPEGLAEYDTETIDDDVIKRFFTAAADLYRVEPWTCASGQALRLSAPALELPDAVVVFDGESDHEFSLMLLESPEEFIDFIHATGSMEPEEELPVPTVVVRSFHYERGASIPREVRRMISELGLDVANARAYPSLIVIGADGNEKPPTALDHRRISACAAALTALIRDHRDAFIDGENLEIELDLPDSPQDTRLVVRSGDEHQTISFYENDESGYDAMQGPDDPERWLDLPEEDRLTVISDHHERLGEPEDAGTNANLHNSFHLIVENQLAMDDPPQARKTLERLLAEGLDRHEAIHAISAVVASMIFDGTKKERPFSRESYAKKLATFDVATWHAEYEATESDGGKPKKSSRKKRKKKSKKGKTKGR